MVICAVAGGVDKSAAGKINTPAIVVAIELIFMMENLATKTTPNNLRGILSSTKDQAKTN